MASEPSSAKFATSACSLGVYTTSPKEISNIGINNKSGVSKNRYDVVPMIVKRVPNKNTEMSFRFFKII